MRIFFLLFLTIILNSCTNETNGQRNYIISQSKENLEKKNEESK